MKNSPTGILVKVAPSVAFGGQYFSGRWIDPSLSHIYNNDCFYMFKALKITPISQSEIIEASQQLKVTPKSMLVQLNQVL